MGTNVKMILAAACFAVMGGLGCEKQGPPNTRSQMPDREPCVRVVLHCSQASPWDVETRLATAIEKVLMAMAGSEKVTTTCQTGLCTAKVYFTSETKIGTSLDLVRRKMRDFQASLPGDVDGYEVSVFQEPSPIATVDVYGDLPIHELVDAAEQMRTRVLEDVPDSVTAEISGQKETRIQLEPSRMAAYAIGAGQILESLRASRDASVPSTLPSIMIGKGILLEDIATVSQGYSVPIIRTDGKACVEIRLYAPSKNQASVVAERVRESVDRQRAHLPENIQCRMYSHVEGTRTGPVRLRVPQIDRGLASSCVLALEKLEAVESVRSVVTEHQAIIELTFKSNVQCRQAITLVRDNINLEREILEIEIVDPGLQGGPMRGRALPRKEPALVIERCPPLLLARVDISGADDIDALSKAATQISTRLREIKGIGSIEMEGCLRLRKRIPRPRFDMAKLVDLGISPQEVRQELKMLDEEGEVMEMNGGVNLVRILYRNDNGSDSRDLLRHTIMTSKGQMIPLDVLVDVDFTWDIPEITRVNGIRVGSMNVHSDGTCDTAELMKRMRSILDDAMNKAGSGIEARLFAR